MCTVFWDRRGILLVDFLTRGETVNAELYCQTLQKFRLAIQNKRCGMLSVGVVLLHNIARSHMTRRSIHLPQEFSWEVFNQPLYTRTSRSMISTFSFISTNSCPFRVTFSEWQRSRDECHTVDSIQGGKFIRQRDTNVGPAVWQISQFQRWICWIIAQRLLCLFR